MSMTWFAAALVMITAFVGLATDSGMVWITRTQLQHSVDAAAMAAAQELPGDQASATAKACEYSVNSNPVSSMFGKLGTTCSGKADVTFPDSTRVRVTAYKTVNPIFGRLAGFKPLEVQASATAGVGSAGEACLFPIFLTERVVDRAMQGNPNRPYPVIIADEPDASGNVDGAFVTVGSLDATSNNGSNAIKNSMVDRTCQNSANGVVGNVLDSKQGVFTQFKGNNSVGFDGWLALSEKSPPAGSCPNPNVFTYATLNPATGKYELPDTITLDNCRRLVIIAVLENGSYSQGSSKGKILGFAAFWLGGVCQESGSRTCTVNLSAYGGPAAATLNPYDFWGFFVPLEVASKQWTTYSSKYGTKTVTVLS